MEFNLDEEALQRLATKGMNKALTTPGNPLRDDVIANVERETGAVVTDVREVDGTVIMDLTIQGKPPVD